MRTSIATTSRLALFAATTITILLSVAAGLLIGTVVQRQDDLAFAPALQHHLSALSAAGNTFLLAPADPIAFAAVISQGRLLKEDLRKFGPDDPDAREATRAVDLMIEAIASTAAASGRTPPFLTTDRWKVDPEIRELLFEISAHGNALDTAAREAKEAERSEIIRKTRFLLMVLAVLGMLLAGVSFAGLFLLHRRVGLPLKALADTIRRIDSGETGVRMPETRSGELGEIARAFNGLMARHEASRRDLARSVALVRMASEVAQFGGWRYVIGAPKQEWTEGTARIHDLPPGWSPTVEEGILFYHEEDRARIKADFGACLETGAPFDGIYRLITATGREVTVRSVGEAERDASGKTVAVHGAFQDITTLRALDQQLFEAQKLDTIGQLTGGIAHDFNNLLTIILGNADLLVDAAPDERTRRLAGAVLEAAERGADLTDSLLAYSRRQPLRPVPTDVGKLIERSANLFRQGVPREIDILYRLHAPDAIAAVDPGRLQSSLLNLLLNASHAIGERGCIRIETEFVEIDRESARAQPETQPGPYVCISVSDDGEGMTPQTAARAFEPFFTTKPEGMGSGLGLSSVYGFLRQSGGHARIQSELGSGTTVRLYVPLTNERETDGAGTSEPATMQGRNEHVLVVEDDAALRKNVEEQLARLSYRVTSAADADEALAALEAAPDVDLLFTDLVMPGPMNGDDLAHVAKGRKPGLKVLFTSGYALQRLLRDGRLEQGTQLLTKPYRSSELARAVRVALDETLT